MKVEASHRAHFARIAAASEAIERERRAQAALERPERKLEEALRLSNALLKESQEQAEPHEVPRFSLIERWRARKAKDVGDDRR